MHAGSAGLRNYELEAAFDEDVRGMIQQIVKEKRLRGVIVEGTVVYQAPGRTVDITRDGVVDQLNGRRRRDPERDR